MAVFQRKILVLLCIYFTLEEPIHGKVTNCKYQGVYNINFLRIPDSITRVFTTVYILYQLSLTHETS